MINGNYETIVPAPPDVTDPARRRTYNAVAERLLGHLRAWTPTTDVPGVTIRKGGVAIVLEVHGEADYARGEVEFVLRDPAGEFRTARAWNLFAVDFLDHAATPDVAVAIAGLYDEIARRMVDALVKKMKGDMGGEAQGEG